MFYAADTLCTTTNVNTANWYPVKTGVRGTQLFKSPGFVVLVDRTSSCVFDQQVRIAHSLGATAVLIANDRCRCLDLDSKICSGYNSNHNNRAQYAEYQGNNGGYRGNNGGCDATFSFDERSGVEINIPTFLILKQDADAIKKLLQNKEHVKVEMTFPTLEPIRQVNYGMWMNPMHQFSQSMLSFLKGGAIALGSSAVFTPHEAIIDGQQLECEPAWGKTKCNSFCTNNNRYCATNPYAPSGVSAVSGQEIVSESLRRLCVWKHYGQDGIGVEW